MNRLAKTIAAMTLVGMGGSVVLCRRPALDDYSDVRFQIDYSDQKQQQRQEIVAHAEHLLGRPYLSQENPESFSCIDVFVRSACGLEEKLREDYTQLQNPQARYAPIDLRVPVCVANINAMLSNDFNNTPENPFFSRRIQNVLRYQEANGLFFRPEQQNPRPGMIVYWAKRNSVFPTHAGVITRVEDGEVQEVIHASATKGRVIKSSEQYVEDAGYHIFGFGDAPN